MLNQIIANVFSYMPQKLVWIFSSRYIAGVTPDLRQSIIDRGHLMRVYVPFGEKWFNYCTRRLKENPKMAQQIIKALFIRGLSIFSVFAFPRLGRHSHRTC